MGQLIYRPCKIRESQQEPDFEEDEDKENKDG
jgi:hypothetical protein